MSESNKQSELIEATRVVLGTKKEVVLRFPKIRDQDMAMQLAAGKAKDNAFLVATHASKELLKILLLQIDGRSISRQEVEKLDDLFSLGEYNQLLQVVGKLTGGSDMGEFQMEHEIFGGK